MVDSGFRSWDDQPYRLWSLYEMLSNYGYRVHKLCDWLSMMAVNINQYAPPNARVSSDWKEEFERAVPLCKELRLAYAITRLRRIMREIEVGSATGLSLVNHLNVLREAIEDQLKSTQFMYIRYPELYDADDPWGPQVAASYPGSSFHIRESNTCLAVNRWTAAVYHTMCALEPGLDSLASALGLPLSQKNWNSILADIGTAIDKIQPHSTPNWKTDKEFHSKAAIGPMGDRKV